MWLSAALWAITRYGLRWWCHGCDRPGSSSISQTRTCSFSNDLLADGAQFDGLPVGAGHGLGAGHAFSPNSSNFSNGSSASGDVDNGRGIVLIRRE